MTTFAYRKPMVAHGYLMRDAELYKTISMMHLANRLLPTLVLPRDVPGLTMAVIGFAPTVLATARLGMVGTYFGPELVFVKPGWIEGFPVGTIPLPINLGHLLAFGTLLEWRRYEIATESAALLVACYTAHMACYTAHIVQEILFSSR